MTQLMHRQERTANNLANANTIGYKKGRVFTDVLSEYLDNEGSPQSVDRLQGWIDTSQGPLQKTGNPLDVAISGEGFFAVTDNNGNRFYTRAGRFTLDADGVLRDLNGYAVQGESGAVVIPPEHTDSITIDEDGTIRLGNRAIDRLTVVRFENPRTLQHREGSLLAADGQVPRIMDTPNVQQGFIEQSNVETVGAMIDMIEQARFFEAQQRWIRTTDQLLAHATRQIGKF